MSVDKNRPGGIAAALALSFVFAAAACTTTTPPTQTAMAPSPGAGSAFGKSCAASSSEPATVRNLKTQIHAYTNASRRRHGANAIALTCERGLVAIADSHSDWMARAKKMSHRNNRGQEPYDRLIAHYPSYRGSVAENLGVITTTYSGPGAKSRAANYSFDADAMAKNFVDGWMNSPGHRKNLLHPRMTHLGVGVAVRGTSIYVTQVFADPAE